MKVIDIRVGEVVARARVLKYYIDLLAYWRKNNFPKYILPSQLQSLIEDGIST